MKMAVGLFCCLFVATPLAAQISPLVLPGDDVGEEHYGDPPAIPEGEQWLGLYARGDSSWVQPVEVTLEVRPSAEPGEPGTHEYSVDPGNPVVLMIGVERARVGSAVTLLAFTAPLLSSAPSKSLRLASTEYRLELVARSSDECDGVITLTDGTSTQRLYDAAADTTYSCDEPHLDVHWVGDLDADGRLDLLATFSTKYSYHPRRLYLSSAAGPGELVAPVSLFER